MQNCEPIGSLKSKSTVWLSVALNAIYTIMSTNVWTPPGTISRHIVESFILKQSCIYQSTSIRNTVYPKKYAHGFCFAVLCCGYSLTDFPISIRLTSLALWQSNACPSASKATLMNMDKYFMWIHYERLHNHNKAKHSKTVCIFLGIYCKYCISYLHVLMVFKWLVSALYLNLHEAPV